MAETRSAVIKTYRAQRLQRIMDRATSHSQDDVERYLRDDIAHYNEMEQLIDRGSQQGLTPDEEACLTLLLKMLFTDPLCWYYSHLQEAWLRYYDPYDSAWFGNGLDDAADCLRLAPHLCLFMKRYSQQCLGWRRIVDEKLLALYNDDQNEVLMTDYDRERKRHLTFILNSKFPSSHLLTNYRMYKEDGNRTCHDCFYELECNGILPEDGPLRDLSIRHKEIGQFEYMARERAPQFTKTEYSEFYIAAWMDSP